MPKTQRVIDNQYKNYQNANNAEKIEAEDFNAIFQNKKKKFKDRIADLIPEFTENLQEHPSAPKLKINDSSIEFVNHITNECKIKYNSFSSKIWRIGPRSYINRFEFKGNNSYAVRKCI